MSNDLGSWYVLLFTEILPGQTDVTKLGKMISATFS